MKKTVTLLVTGFFAVCFPNIQLAQESPIPMGDIEISQKLLYIWIVYAQWPPTSVPNHFDGTEVYSPNGEFITKGVFTIVDDKQPLEYQGTWQIKDGFLIETVTKSSTKAIRVGLVTHDKIIRIDDKEMIYQTEKGKTVNRKRKPDA